MVSSAHIPAMSGDAACPRGPDNIETQPVDITCTSPPVEPPAPEASPPCPAEKKREAYQKRSKGSDEPPPQSNDVSMLPEKSNAGNGDKTTPVAPNDEEKEHFTETDEEPIHGIQDVVNDLGFALFVGKYMCKYMDIYIPVHRFSWSCFRVDHG